MNLFHVFTNNEQTVFSSSFAALLKAGPRKFCVNILAVKENILSGYIIGPETVVDGVYLVDSQYRRQINAPGIVFEQQSREELTLRPPRKTSFASCVDEQIAALDHYFALLKNLVDDLGGVDIGLSGGYDSRLLVLMAKRHFARIYAHSHYHREMTVDEAVAQKIAGGLSIPLYRCEIAKQHVDMEVEEFERNLDNTATYNDGRVFHDYSWLNYFRTRWYREMVLRGLRFGMNGLGGELYRNHDNHIYEKVSTREWMKARVLGSGVYSSIQPRALDEVLDAMLLKAGTVLGERLNGQISHHQTRRYFGEIFSVYCAAIRLNIDNQLTFSLSPFLDYQLRVAAYRVLPHLGLAGRVEREMIRRLNPTVAAITSTYGYSFDHREPNKNLLKFAARGLFTYGMQNRFYDSWLQRTRSITAAYDRLYNQQPYVRRAVEIMRSTCFSLVWERIVQDSVLLQRVLSIGLMILKYEDCLWI